jgi:hypothetical protein
MEHIRLRVILSSDAVQAIRTDDEVGTEDFTRCERNETSVRADSVASCVVSNLGTEVGGSTV